MFLPLSTQTQPGLPLRSLLDQELNLYETVVSGYSV